MQDFLISLLVNEFNYIEGETIFADIAVNKKDYVLVKFMNTVIPTFSYDRNTLLVNEQYSIILLSTNFKNGRDRINQIQKFLFNQKSNKENKVHSIIPMNTQYLSQNNSNFIFSLNVNLIYNK